MMNLLVFGVVLAVVGLFVFAVGALTKMKIGLLGWFMVVLGIICILIAIGTAVFWWMVVQPWWNSSMHWRMPMGW